MRMPWSRAPRRKPVQLPVEPLTLRAMLWLLATLVLAVAPYVSELPIGLTGLFYVIALWRCFIAVRHQALPPRWLLLPLALLAGAGVLIEYRTLLGRDAGVALLTAMTACKLLETRGLRDGVVLIFLGYLLVMSHLLYSQEMLMVGYLFAVVVVMLAAQTMIYQQHAGLSALAPLRLAGKMAAQAIPVMLILFVLFPRIPGPLWGLPKDAYQGRTGLSEEMSPGSVSALSKSDAVAFRVRFVGPSSPPPKQLYWRGPVLWNFDGRRWTRDEELPANTPVAFTPEGAAVEYTVIMEPSNRRWLLALDLPASLPPRTGMTPSFQLLRDQPVNEVYRYDVRSYPNYRTGELTAVERSRALRLPPRGNARARELAVEWRARDPQPEALIKAALTLFREQAFYYTLTPPLLGAESVDDFLFRTREGFCEHYASTFVFLMRAAGVPARVVTGYQGGEINALGDYLIVRQADAHAWAEVWLAERGWVRVDPTAAVAPNRIQEGLYAAIADDQTLPFLARRGGGNTEWLRQLALRWDALNTVWNEWVLAYGPDRQKEFLSGLGFGPVDWGEMTVAMTVALSGFGLLFAGLRWRRRWIRDPVARAWQQFCARLARRGLARGAHEGPLAFAERVAMRRPELAMPASEIGKLYAALRYGPTVPPPAVRRLQRLVRRFRA